MVPAVRVLLALVLVLAAPGAAAFAQQGEGNGYDNVLSVAVGPAPFSTADQQADAGDVLALKMTTGTLFFGRPIVFFSRAPCGTPQPVFNFGPLEPGVLGIDPAVVELFYDGVSFFPPQIMGFQGTFTVWAAMQPQYFTAGHEDIFFQTGILDPSSGAPLGWAISNTVRVTTLRPGLFQDTPHLAACAPSLGDVELGLPLAVDTADFGDRVAVQPGASGRTDDFALIANPLAVDQARDAWLRFTADLGGAYAFEAEAAHAVRLAAIEPDGDLRVFAEANAVGAGGGPATRLVVCLAPGEEILVLVDGGAAGAHGPVDLVLARDDAGVETQSAAAGAAAGGELLTLQGCGLAGVTTVSFGAQTVVPTTVTDGAVTCVVPAGTAGATVGVQLLGAGPALVAPDGWSYAP